MVKCVGVARIRRPSRVRTPVASGRRMDRRRKKRARRRENERAGFGENSAVDKSHDRRTRAEAWVGSGAREVLLRRGRQDFAIIFSCTPHARRYSCREREMNNRRWCRKGAAARIRFQHPVNGGVKKTLLENITVRVSTRGRSEEFFFFGGNVLIWPTDY